MEIAKRDDSELIHPEAAEQSGGWAIGDREPYSPDRDEAHAAGLYSLLENEIVPMY